MAANEAAAGGGEGGEPYIAGDSREVPKYRRGSEVSVINAYSTDRKELKKELEALDKTKETAGLRMTKDQLELLKKIELLNNKKAMASSPSKKGSDGLSSSQSQAQLASQLATQFGSQSIATAADTAGDGNTADFNDFLLLSNNSEAGGDPPIAVAEQPAAGRGRRRSLSAMSNWKPVSFSALAAANNSTSTIENATAENSGVAAAAEATAAAAGGEASEGADATSALSSSASTQQLRMKRGRSFSTGSQLLRRNSILATSALKEGQLTEEDPKKSEVDTAAYYFAQRQQALDDLDNEFLDPSYRFRKEIEQLNALNQLTTDLQKKRADNEAAVVGRLNRRKTSVDMSASIGTMPVIVSVDKRPTPADFATQKFPTVAASEKADQPPPTLARRMSINRGVLLEALPQPNKSLSSSSGGDTLPPVKSPEAADPPRLRRESIARPGSSSKK
eukprot:Opistho-2@9663